MLSLDSAIWGMEKYLEAAKERRRKQFEVLSVREQKVETVSLYQACIYFCPLT